ncbi:vacuolar protein sorting-associated protein 13B isoform X3 [Sceloporus undulatus]|uniref:vacuolar protein sorting-associated protein 13B isoform X3 n=1 Tax=Sceloporus undulatus TaxID=8520 RepID=UPI001C4D767C|nr:vacuolar protein sorting-associated protein 13B isoform X3 [Sceloporus undulatus]
MLESYVTPILMSYVNRYIKNLKPSDLQLSLWGGDVVLSKLELKLDVLEQELKLPFTFLSGHIHELRIHVPWTKLGSEPVVITINTMECILKLKDGAQDDHESCGSSSTNRSTSESTKTAVKPRRIQQATPDPDLPPGYVQSLIWRVINNVNIVINNLILKYVEDDIVLSVNITSAECFTVDEFWDRAFMDISATDLVLRKVINFSDCTVCLDKRNASGKIEFYQDPLLYKCSFRTRLHFTYDNLNSKMPSIIKIHTLVESLKLSITDQQLPMFIRIMQLGISLYYGEIGNLKDGENEDLICHTKDVLGNISGSEDEVGKDMQYISPESYAQQDDDQQQGWVSWAWSFVPAIVGNDDDEGYCVGIDDGTTINPQKLPTVKDPIVSIGFYCTKATITFKLTEMQAESSYYSPQKVKSKEIICWEQEGTTVEVLMHGEPFFDCQIGFVGCHALCLKSIMGIKDFEENMNRSDSEAYFFHCGENLSTKGMTYLTNSLFDYRSPENNGVRAEFILDGAVHKEMYTEITGMQRFGAFYMDYLYTMDSTSGKVSGNQPDVTSVKTEDFGNIQEMSSKSLIVGPLSLRLDSSAVHRIMKMVVCALEHEYEPYSKSKLDFVDGAKTVLNSDEVAALEEYIPTRITNFTILKCTVTIPMAEFNLLGHLLPIIMGQKSSSSFLNTANLQPLRPLPCIQMLVDKVVLEHSVPMYAEQLVQTVSSLNQPSDNLLHYCYAHCYLKIFGFQAGLSSLDVNGSYSSPAPVVPPLSTAFYGKMLKLPKCWSKWSNVAVKECIFELPNLTIQATRAQTFLMQTIWQSWAYTGNVSSPVVNEALVNEVFQLPGAVLLVSVQGLTVNIDPVLYTWLVYLPQKRSSRPMQQQSGSVSLGTPVTRKKEDEASVGSTPLAKQQSNQASEYASSPVKTKTVTESRPLSVPMKAMLSSLESCNRSPEERMKECIGVVWNAVKRLTLQLEVQSCCMFIPNDSLPSPSTIVLGDIPGTVRSWYHGQAHMPGTLVLCLPQIKVMSAGHKYMEPLQEIPFVVQRPILEEGDAFPWTINLDHFSVYTLLGQQMTLNLIEPMGCTSTLAVTSQMLHAAGPESKNSFVVCLHVDLESLEVKCSNPQVQLLYELTDIMSKVWNKIQKKGVLHHSQAHTESASGPAPPSSPIKSSVGTAPPDTSTCSPSADFGTTTEGESLQGGDDSPFSDSITLEQTTSNIGISSGRVSLWMQWMLPKLTVKLFAPDPENKGTEICVVGELEDLSASVDVQDVYTKVKCKIESFNVDHYRNSFGEDSWSLGKCGGVFLSCTDKLNRRTLLVRPVSKQDPFSNFSGFFPSATAKLLDGSHQQHGFLSLTYTKAVTKNVRHKLISRNERRTLHKLSEGFTDGSPHFLHEILLSAQAFDVVLCFPFLNAIASIFQAKRQRNQKEKRKSPGQPMRTHILTSRNLPLIYINTGVIRVFFPKMDRMQHNTEDCKTNKEDTLVFKIGSVSMAPQADNPLGRVVLRKDIYQRALNLGILRDPGSEVEDRQYQIDLQSINIGTAQWDQLKPEKENGKGRTVPENERNSQNPALEWNMASSIKRHQERRAILTPILTDFTVRITAAPAIIFTKVISPENLHTEEILVCGHSLEVNMTTSLDFFLSVAQVQLLQQLIQANMAGLEPCNKAAEVSKHEQKKMDMSDGGMVETSSRYSGAQDSGIGSDSVKIRIVQIEQHSGTSHHRIARPSRQSSIVKNLNFIPFDIFITGSRISFMTYSSTSLPKSKSTEDQRDDEKSTKNSLNLTETIESDCKKTVKAGISSVTAEDLLNSNNSLPPGKKTGLLSLESLHASTRSSARQALGITIVRQPGRRGTGDLQLEPFLHLVVSQPSLILSCHHRKQRMEISVFDAVLKGVASDYKCADPGKTLPETLDYCKTWLQTVAGEIDAKSGIPPPLITLQIKDFLNGPAEINVDIAKPLKANISFVKLDQIKQFLKKIRSKGYYETQEENVSAADSLPKKDDTLTYQCYKSRIPDSEDYSDGGQKISAQKNLWTSISCCQKISIHTTQMVISMETCPDPRKPCLLASLSSLHGNLLVKAKGRINGSSLMLDISDFLIETSLQEKSRMLLGPVCFSVTVEAKWCKHSGNPGPELSVPKVHIDVRSGLMQVFWGQEHLNCLVLLHEHLQSYFLQDDKEERQGTAQINPVQIPTESNQGSKTEHTSDDLRTGLFQYIQDTEAQKLPSAYEVVFYNETEDNPGMMLWRYPEPRVLTLVRITPVPFNTTEDPDISTADLGDVLQIPCSLEYWDELQKAFVAFREFSLSESKVCELSLPTINLITDQKELVASDLWRIVLNSNQNSGDDQSTESETGSQSACDQLVTPTALAACTRVDSCFTPWFVPSLGVSIQFAHLELHLCHHLDQLGTGTPKFLHPFTSDKNVPSELEYLIISFKKPHIYLRQWSDGSVFKEIQFSSKIDCKHLEYRNLTMQGVVKPFGVFGQVAISGNLVEKLLDANVMVDPIFISFGQHAVYSLHKTIQAWQQNQCPEAEELVFSHFVICNDTQETLRFGQVDTDENVLLASLHSHQYSWRSHKSPQLLHICIEGWGNWRWSEPFSIDNVGTFIRTIQYKGRTASLIIKVQPLNGVQKQIIICGRQIVCSYLSESIEVKVVQHYIGQDGQAVVKEHFDCLAPKQKLPSYVLENNELTELSVKAKGDEDWSRDVSLESKHTEYSTVVQVPSSNSSIIYVWCMVLTLEANSQVEQRIIVFSPLFIMRSHLPDPIIIHLEKRSLGLNEIQMIPGKGQEKPLQNIEPDLTHHLTFQAREEDDPSECAVPISTTLIKQIATKSNTSGTANEILADFYGFGSPPQSVWPYTKKDFVSSEQLTQWDSPMRVKLSVWKPCVKTLLIELLPWALLINHSKWDLWLFEGEKIMLQIPAGKTMIPPNFQEAFQIGIYWANTNTVHKSVAIKLVHNMTSPKWKDGDNEEVVTLDEEGFVEAEIRLGAFPGHQKLCQFCISSIVQRGIQILQIEDKSIIVNNTPYQIYYKPQLSVMKSQLTEEFLHVPDSSTFSICSAMESDTAKSSSILFWDLMHDISQSVSDVLPLQKYMLLSFRPGTNDPTTVPCWSPPAIIKQEFPRQSIAIPICVRDEHGFSTRAIALTYQEHLGVTYLTLSEDPSPRIIIHNRCPVSMLIKENFKDTPKFDVYCKHVPAESSVHHELYHQVSSYPDCKTKDLVPSIVLKVLSSEELTNEWSDFVDINNQGTQIVFLTGFGYVYVDVAHQCGSIVITLAPEGRPGHQANLNRTQEQSFVFKTFISQLSLTVNDDISNPKMSSELLRFTIDHIYLHMVPVASYLRPLSQEFNGEATNSVQQFYTLQIYCGDLQLDNQLYSKSNFHFPVLLCQGEKNESIQWTKMHSIMVSSKDLEEYSENSFIKLCLTLSGEQTLLFHVNELSFEMKPARLYVEDTFVYYVKTLFETYLPDSKNIYHSTKTSALSQILPEQVKQHANALVNPVKLRKLAIQPVNLLVSIHASLKLYIASDHTPLSFSVFERGPVFTTARQLIHALAMHYAAGALFRAGWVVGSLEILGSPASLVRSIGNGIADFFRLPYEGLTRGPGAFVSGVSRGTTSFVKHISKGTLTSITNLATSLARNMDRLSLDEEHYNRQEEWRRQLPENLGEGLRQGLSRLGISLLGAIAGIVDQPMQNFQKTSEAQASAGHKAKGVISGVGKGIMGVFAKPIGGAAELVSQTGYGILHGAGLSQHPKQRCPPSDQHAEQAPNSHVKYVWKMLQSLGRPEAHMALEVIIVSGSGQEHEGCLLLTSEVLFVVSISEDTQQQAFPVTEIECSQDSEQNNLMKVQLKQQRVPCDSEAEGGRERLSEQQYNRLVDYITKASYHFVPGAVSVQTTAHAVAVEPIPTTVKTYQYLVDPVFSQIFISKFTMVKNKALKKGFN